MRDTAMCKSCMKFLPRPYITGPLHKVTKDNTPTIHLAVVVEALGGKRVLCGMVRP